MLIKFRIVNKINKTTTTFEYNKQTINFNLLLYNLLMLLLLQCLHYCLMLHYFFALNESKTLKKNCDEVYTINETTLTRLCLLC